MLTAKKDARGGAFWNAIYIFHRHGSLDRCSLSQQVLLLRGVVLGPSPHLLRYVCVCVCVCVPPIHCSRCRRVIMINIVLAMVLKFLVLAFSVWVRVPLWVAILADVGSLLLVLAHGVTLLQPLHTHEGSSTWEQRRYDYEGLFVTPPSAGDSPAFP